MKDEIKSMQHNKVRDPVKLPKGRKRFGLKWVFKTKYNSKANNQETFS